MKKAIILIVVIIVLLLMKNVRELQRKNDELRMEQAYENGLKISGEFNDNYC